MKTATSENKEHAEYSASGSARWINCPGSHVAGLGVPDLPENKYAVEGTKAHACHELLLQNRGNLQAAVKLALKTYPKEMVGYGLESVQYILSRAAEIPGSVILCERQVNSSPFLGVEDQFGTLDASVVQEFGRLIVADYKYGAGIAVDPREDDGRLNSQLAYYALGLSYEYDHNFDSVELIVIQPRAFHPSGETIRSTVATMDELMGWADTFRSAVEATKTSSERHAGKWCKFCKLSLTCPELKDKSFKAAQIAFSDTAGITSLPAVTSLPNLGVVLGACDKLEEWIGKVRAHAIDVLNRGGEVPGFKLVEKRGTRKWVGDAPALMQEALDTWGVESHEEPKLKSPAQFEKTFGKAAKDWVAERVTTVVSGTTLATADDKRPAVTGLADVFGVIDA